MIIDVPDNYAATLRYSLIITGHQIIDETNIVPAYLHKIADIYNQTPDRPFDYWSMLHNVSNAHVREVLVREHLTGKND